MVIEINNGVARHPLWRMASPVNLQIDKGEQIAIVGDNAAGKSRLVELLTGHYPLLMNDVKYDFSPSVMPLVSDNLKYISFRDSYGEQDGTYYYQQRWNHHDIDENTPTVGQLLKDSFEKADAGIPDTLTPQERAVELERRHALRRSMADMFSLSTLMDKYIISLSSGELRKFQLARALGMGPRMLVMDNPFIGLDVSARDMLRHLLGRLAAETGLQVVLILSRDEDIPPFITHVLPVENLTLMPKQTLQEYLSTHTSSAVSQHDDTLQWILSLPTRPIDAGGFYPQQGGEILGFHKVSIRYGRTTILDSLDWTVHEGERWAVSGENGSGKSTLLSLVCADNPQAYACDISLFGHRRGSGESIWEIKRHIGYVSPEMHRAYLKDLPAIDIVASGLNDSVGLYVRPKPSQREMCLQWMKAFGIEHLADVTFLKMSSGEQRLCLLARAFVKDPELLILDEPLHGLDNVRRALVRDIIETFCHRPHKTLVMVTHYAEELPPCISHTLILKKTARP